VRTSVPIPVNASKRSKLTDAAAGTFLHEGRKPDFRCALHRGLLSGTKLAFAALAPMSVFRKPFNKRSFLEGVANV
jgi:hypothetical protein